MKTESHFNRIGGISETDDAIQRFRAVQDKKIVVVNDSAESFIGFELVAI